MRFPSGLGEMFWVCVNFNRCQPSLLILKRDYATTVMFLQYRTEAGTFVPSTRYVYTHVLVAAFYLCYCNSSDNPPEH